MGKIRIYTNESVDVAIAEGLKRRGVDVFSARDTGNLGLTDEEQLVFADNEKAAIFTHEYRFLVKGFIRLYVCAPRFFENRQLI